VQESNLRLPKGSADCGTVAGDAGEPPLTSPCSAILKDAAGAGNPVRAKPNVGPPRTSCQEVSMVFNRLRLRGVLAAALAFVPLLLAACNKGGSSGY
jgi:hypothetical protein